jgi:DNA-binding NarL/FixJ family response regulator
MVVVKTDSLVGRVLALVVGRPGPLQDSLAALLATIPVVDMVVMSDDISAILDSLSDWNPDLILLDSALFDPGVSDVLCRARELRPHARWILLADNVQQQQDAAVGGADVALLKGSPAAELVLAIETLLPSV